MHEPPTWPVCTSSQGPAMAPAHLVLLRIFTPRTQHPSMYTYAPCAPSHPSPLLPRPPAPHSPYPVLPAPLLLVHRRVELRVQRARHVPQHHHRPALRQHGVRVCPRQARRAQPGGADGHGQGRAGGGGGQEHALHRVDAVGGGGGCAAEGRARRMQGVVGSGGQCTACTTDRRRLRSSARHHKCLHHRSHPHSPHGFTFDTVGAAGASGLQWRQGTRPESTNSTAHPVATHLPPLGCSPAPGAAVPPRPACPPPRPSPGR